MSTKNPNFARSYNLEHKKQPDSNTFRYPNQVAFGAVRHNLYEPLKYVIFNRQ